MTQARNFIGTLNNPEVLAEDYIEAWHSKGEALYVTGQLEKGAEGTPHIQFFLHFAKNRRIAALKKHCPKAHFEVVKVNNGADDYCNKEETRLEGPWSHGIKPARNNKKGEVGARNRAIIEMGVVKAVEQGYIPIAKLRQVKQSIDLYNQMAK